MSSNPSMFGMCRFLRLRHRASLVALSALLVLFCWNESYASGKLRRDAKSDPAVLALVDRFNAEIDKKFPDFTALDEVARELRPLDRDQAGDARQILSSRASFIADETIFAIEKALQANDASSARFAVDYLGKHQRVMGVPFDRVVALEERVRKMTVVGQKESVIDRDLEKAGLLLAEYKFGDARQVLQLVNHNFDKVKATVSKAQRKEMTGKIAAVTADLNRVEDSLINAGITVLRTQGIQAVIEYRERMLIRNRADRSKLNNLDEAIFRAQTAEKEREDSLRHSEEVKATQARLERDRLERERLERQRTEEKRLADEEQRKQDLARVERERAEQERIRREAEERKRQDADQRERERLERERVAREQAERSRQERERIAREKAEQARIAAERQRELQQAQIEEARRKGQEREAARLEQERTVQESAERTRVEAERRDRAQQARLDKEQRRREEKDAKTARRSSSKQERAEQRRLEEYRRAEQERIEEECREQERLRLLEEQRQREEGARAAKAREEEAKQARGSVKQGRQTTPAPSVASAPRSTAPAVTAAPTPTNTQAPAYQTREHQIIAQQKTVELYTRLESNEIISARALYQKDRQYLKSYLDPEAFSALEFALFPETTRREAAAKRGDNRELREQISRIYLLLERNDVNAAYTSFNQFVKPSRNSMDPAEYSQLETIVTKAYQSLHKR